MQPKYRLEAYSKNINTYTFYFFFENIEFILKISYINLFYMFIFISSTKFTYVSSAWVFFLCFRH